MGITPLEAFRQLKKSLPVMSGADYDRMLLIEHALTPKTAPGADVIWLYEKKPAEAPSFRYPWEG